MDRILKNNWALSTISGLTFILSWPEIGGLSFLSFIAVTPILFIAQNLKNLEKGWLKFIGFSFVALLIWNLGTTWWVFNASAGGAIGAFVLNALFLAVALLGYFLTEKIMGGTKAWFSLFFFWIGWEYFHLDWDLSWPWLTLGNVFANSTWAVQWYEYTGVFGGSAWVLFMNMIFFKAIQKIQSKQVQMGGIVVPFLFWSLLPIVSSLFILLNIETPEDAPEINTIVVQPNVDPYNQKFGPEGQALLLRGVDKGVELLDDNKEESFIVLPETALQEWNHFRMIEGKPKYFGLWERNFENAITMQDLRKYNSFYPNLKFVGGLSTDRIVEANKDNAESRRYLKEIDSFYESYNSGFYFSKDDSIQIYHKSKLVVSVEKFPFKSILEPVLGDAVIDLGGSTGTLGVQKEQIPFLDKSTGAKIAPVICYESIYGEFVNRFILNGANVIFILTNDGWWGDTPGYKQHLAYARLRAIETRRYIARSANTGVSCFIDEKGEVYQKTDYWTVDAIKQKIPLLNKLTFYVRYGDMIGRTCVFLAVLMLIYLFVFSKKTKT